MGVSGVGGGGSNNSVSRDRPDNTDRSGDSKSTATRSSTSRDTTTADHARAENLVVELNDQKNVPTADHAQAENLAARLSEQSGVPTSDTAQAENQIAAEQAKKEAESHTVVPGDTMSHLAKKHGVDLQAMIAANPQVKNPDLIYPGDVLNIPPPGQRRTTLSSGQGPQVASGGLSAANMRAQLESNMGLYRGAEGPAVEQLQTRLNELGYNSGTADGKFGPITQGALQSFQRANNLPAYGVVDEATKAALDDPNTPARVQGAGVEQTAPNLQVYPPNSPEAVALFRDAARLAGLPESWASSPGLHNILRRESGGKVGIPNYTYGARARDPSQWASVHAELKAGRKTTRSSATGLGQLLLANVDAHYPNGRAGIGDPVQEAAGMLNYIKSRYGNPENAWAQYGVHHEGY